MPYAIAINFWKPSHPFAILLLCEVTVLLPAEAG